MRPANHGFFNARQKRPNIPAFLHSFRGIGPAGRRPIVSEVNYLAGLYVDKPLFQ